jgi:GntR family transcriptional regulator
MTSKSFVDQIMTKPSSEFVTKKIPLYYQLENILREKIMSGVFAAGARLPTEAELIRLYGVGRRTFEERIDLTGSLDETIAAEAGATFKVIEMNRVEADPQEAELFGLGAGEPLYRVKRLGLRGDKPRNLTIDYLPAEIGEKLTIEELSAGSLLQTLETRFGLKLKSVTQRINAALADPYLAKLLDVRVGSPMLSIERAVYAGGAAPVEFSQTLFAADLEGYAIRLTRGRATPQATKSRKRRR